MSYSKEYSAICNLASFIRSTSGSLNRVDMEAEIKKVKLNRMKTQLCNEIPRCFHCSTFGKSLMECKNRKCSQLKFFLDKHPEYKDALKMESEV